MFVVDVNDDVDDDYDKVLLITHAVTLLLYTLLLDTMIFCLIISSRGRGRFPYAVCICKINEDNQRYRIVLHPRLLQMPFSTNTDCLSDRNLPL